MKKIISSAPGKAILFGEHAVVYGYPAIAIALSIRSKCIIEENTERNIQIFLENYNQRIKAPDFYRLEKKIPSKFNQLVTGLKLLQQKYDLNYSSLSFCFNTQLFPSSGLGSSASIAVAFIYGLNEYFGLGLSKDEINNLAYEMERIIHGTPSGIDNTICTFGNLIYYKGGEFQFIEVDTELPLLIIYSNIEHDTKEAINRIRRFKNTEPERANSYLKSIGKITNKAKNHLQQGNLDEIGDLMNKNQANLSSLHVSNQTISEITNFCLENGAKGSKLTGAGLGGCVISLGDLKILKNISQQLEANGFKSFLANIDKQGVRIE
ncbi:MAG: mevalonate kinase [Candidatus Lokiarchaeota archaeon]|nr:mevalonate kinase [Candidatus Lokiarchaeota archaeon]MBD3200350.1 mevalonate kinase [Candidatus Lokiarchaeota archaeon]